MNEELVKDLLENYDKYFACDVEVVDVIEELSKPHWIPVTEELPNKCGTYCVSDGNEVWTCDFISLGGVIRGWSNSCQKPAVRWWIPLPGPLKEE